MADPVRADSSVNPIDLLTGLLRQAALAKAVRGSKVDALETAALGGGAPPVQPPPVAPSGGPMTQSQFGGPPKTPQQLLLEQQRLAEMLKARQMGVPR